MPEATGADLNTGGSEDEYEYEYEYSTTETESYYIHLDLSSVNGVLRSSNAADRKSLRAPQTPQTKKGKGKGKARDQAANTNIEGLGEHDQDAGADVEGAEVESEAGQDGAGTPQQVETAIDLDGPSDSIQILGLHTENPIVSYRNQIYRCEWTDMIGTNMFFTKHNETPMNEPEIATEDYDLLGTSRIKLVGYKATVTAKKAQPNKSTSRNVNRTHQSQDTPEHVGGEEEAPERTNEDNNRTNLSTGEHTPQIPPRSNIQQNNNPQPQTQTQTQTQTQSHAKRQATFLERLKDIKRARGEHDKVLTFVNRQDPTLEETADKNQQAATAADDHHHHDDEAHEDQDQANHTRKHEIESLNARVVRGDTSALERLQEIYAQDEEGV